jgi:aldehyde dehydrogenase (NAD+)
MTGEAVIARQRGFFRSGATQPAVCRREALRALLAGIEAHESDLLEALREDLGKPATEAWASELGYVGAEIRHALRHLDSWMTPRRHRTPACTWPASAWEQPGPFGVALILGPWNYPVQLLLAPAVAAVAAGNCAVLKPSELAPHSSAVVAALVAGHLDPAQVAVVEGGRETAAALLDAMPDFIFFTGGVAAGREVMAAAARGPVPVVLELGGKSPCIVCADAPIEVAARRIAWGKFLNAGQTCVAPDTVWVDRRIAAEFIAALKRVIHGFFGDDPALSPDYGRIIHARHFERLTAMLGDGVEVLHGGRHDTATRFIEPTLTARPQPGTALADDEIFGPILPVVEFDSLDEVFADLAKRPVPLAVYGFTRDRAIEERLVAATRSGGVCLNDTISHLLPRDLPFGGLGTSGLGASHGKAGFDAFSHRRAVMRRGLFPDPLFRYPPAKGGLAALKRMLRITLG